MEKLKKLFRPEYRVYRDTDGYFYKQKRLWWCPLWLWTSRSSFRLAEQAEKAIQEEVEAERAAGVVKYLGRL